MEGPARLLNRRLLLSQATPPTLNALTLVRVARTSNISGISRFCTFNAVTPIIRASLSPIFPSPRPGLIVDRLLSLSTSGFLSCQSRDPYISGKLNPTSGSGSWFWASNSGRGCDKTLLGSKSLEVTVVLLGWLGAQRKHLKRYASWYNAQGMNAFVFTADIRDFMSLDLGKKVEDQMAALGEELFSWVSKKADDGRDRCLLFHTFSNTGLFVYGYLLNLMYHGGIPNMEEKIKGCVIDSGGGGFLDPKVWAAGWTTALLKKRSSTTHFEFEQGNHQTQQSLLETVILAFLEKFYSAFLAIPDVEKRINAIIAAIKNPPCYPQLYLYSTADKVVPHHAIEAMIQDQKRIGRAVSSYNFMLSPHVDHYRTFPDQYTLSLSDFLEECFETVKRI